jgi:hypothetical protein
MQELIAYLLQYIDDDDTVRLPRLARDDMGRSLTELAQRMPDELCSAVLSAAQEVRQHLTESEGT